MGPVEFSVAAAIGRGISTLSSTPLVVCFLQNLPLTGMVALLPLLSHQYQCKLSCLYCAHTHHMIFVSICCSCHMKQQKKVAHFSHDSRHTNYSNRFTNNLSNFSYDNHSIEGKYQLILSSHKCANQILWFFQPKHIELNLSIKNKAQKTKFFSMLSSFAVWRDKKTREKKVWKVISVE